MTGPRFPTSTLAAKVLACSFHCMKAPGFDEALLAGVDLLGEALVELGRDELGLVFTYVSGTEHGDRVPLLVKGACGGVPDGHALRSSVLQGGTFRVHELLHDLLAPAQTKKEQEEGKDMLTYGGRMALAMASAVALIGGGEELREVWQGFFEDVPQQERMLADLRKLQGHPPGSGLRVGSSA